MRAHRGGRQERRDARGVSDALAFKSKYLADAHAWLNPGGSVIVDPDGKIVAGPANECETILYADVRPDQLIGAKWQLDIAGHYARPDVFELRVNRTPTPIVRKIDATPAPAKRPAKRPARKRR